MLFLSNSLRLSPSVVSTNHVTLVRCMNNDVEPVRCVVMGRWRGCRAPSRQRHHGRLLSSRIGKGESVACLGSADRFAAVYLRGCILHGDHDRSRDPSQLTRSLAHHNDAQQDVCAQVPARCSVVRRGRGTKPARCRRAGGGYRDGSCRTWYRQECNTRTISSVRPYVAAGSAIFVQSPPLLPATGHWLRPRACECGGIRRLDHFWIAVNSHWASSPCEEARGRCRKAEEVSHGRAEGGMSSRLG